MPTYEYRCLGCGKTFSVVQGIRDDKLTVHEGCGGELERLISGGRLMLTDRKGGRPDDAEFAAGPGEWEDDPYGDDMGGMGGMGGMAGMGGLGGMMGGGMGDFGGMGGMGGMGGEFDDDFGNGADDLDGDYGDSEFEDDL